MADFKMPEINYVVLAGNLTHDPVFRKTPNGGSLISFTIALNKRYRDGNNQLKEEVYYINIFALNKLAESCSRKLKRGSAILLEGELLSRHRRNNDKSIITIMEVKARRVQFLNKFFAINDGKCMSENEDIELPSNNENIFISNEEPRYSDRGSPDSQT